MTEPDTVAWDQQLTPLSDPTNVMFVLVPDEELPRTDVIVAAADVHDGAMIAFVPTPDSVVDLVHAVPGGETLDQVHITLEYLGGADEIEFDVRESIIETMTELASRQPIFIADVFSFAVFNPDGPEPCLVAVMSGDDLEDAHASVSEELENIGVECGTHQPWIPHMTLWYGDDPRVMMTDELMERTGPIIIDRIRVAFAGEVTDIPLGGGIVASEAFHMSGHHNQATHGRGGASPGELSAANRLNAGKGLDDDDPEQAHIARTIQAWAGSSVALNREIQDAPGNPGADTDGAKFTRVVAAAPANAPELHRGMAHVDPADVPGQGAVFALGPTSFTRSKKVMEDFGTHSSSQYGRATTVHMHVAKNSNSLRIDHELSRKGNDPQKQQEHVGMGRYRVTKRTERQVTVKTRDGGRKEITLYDIEVAQVGDDVPITHTGGGKAYVPGPGELGL